MFSKTEQMVLKFYARFRADKLLEISRKLERQSRRALLKVY